MATVTPSNKLITIDGLTTYHDALKKYLDNIFLTKIDANNTYLTPKQGDNKYLPLNWASRYIKYDVDPSQQQLNSITLTNDILTAKNLISLTTPTGDNDVVNKKYLDTIIASYEQKIAALTSRIEVLENK